MPDDPGCRGCSLRNYARDCRGEPVSSPTQRRVAAINSALAPMIAMLDWSSVGMEDIFGTVETHAGHEESIRRALANVAAELARTPEQTLAAEQAADEEMDVEMASGCLQ
jgi:hypothetical protein